MGGNCQCLSTQNASQQEIVALHAQSALSPGLPPDRSLHQVGRLRAEDVIDYTPKRDHSHLRLGLRKEGMLLFLEQIGFAQWTGNTEEKAFEGLYGGNDVYKYWTYNQNYARDPDLAAWLDSQVGTVKVGDADPGSPNGGLMNVTGFDLIDYVCKWQRNKGLHQLSVCEIILMEPEFQHLRQYVGIANVYWSHIQRESFLGSFSTSHNQNVKEERSTLGLLNSAHFKFGLHLPPKDQCFCWIDYFCVRQCESDFDVGCTIELITEIGIVVAAVDQNFEFVKQPFCIAEVFAAVHSHGTLLCFQMITTSKENMRQYLAVDQAAVTDENRKKWWVGPIDAAAAQTRRREDKTMIDGFIEQLPGGFDHVNKIVSDALINSAQ